jgi:hypothetical protein
MTAAHRNPEAKPEAGDYRAFRHSAFVEQQRYRGNIAAYFEERRRELDVVATTETPSGQVLDWIPADSQQSGQIASPPPGMAQVSETRHSGRPTTAARFELDDAAAERGPDGTVPVPRKDLADVGVVGPLRRYLSRRRGRGHRSIRSNDGLALATAPEFGGAHRYAETAQSTFNLGAEGFLSINDPYTETSADFSLIEMAVINDERGYVHSAEAGIQEMQSLYGDWGPHLFVYYTTNGYAFEGNNQGGYNRDVDGWVQYDSSVYPGAGFATASTPGGDQYDLFMKFQLFDGNWWFMAGDRWIGYYPGQLYAASGDGGPASSLADYSNAVAFFGEVFDSEQIAGPTSTTMGSGQWAESQWPWAAFQRNLRVQVDGDGSMVDYNASSVVMNSPSMYDLEPHMLSGSSWGSYQWVGGPGAG